MIVVDGAAAHMSVEKIRRIVDPDIHAIQYDETNSIGHIEYKRGPYDDDPRENEMIYEEFDVSKFKELHAAALEEMGKENEL